MNPLIQFPKTALIEIPGFDLCIVDHMPVDDDSFFLWLMHLTKIILEKEGMQKEPGLYRWEDMNPESAHDDPDEIQNRLNAPDIQDIIKDMTSQGIQFRVAMDYCIMELQKHLHVLSKLLGNHSMKHCSCNDAYDVFSASPHGRKLAAEFVKKIRVCNDWMEFFEIFAVNGEFREKIAKNIRWSIQCDL